MIRATVLCLLLFAALAKAELVSTGVGMVRGQVVTSREVQIQNLIEIALDEKNPKFRLLSLDSKAFNKATQDVLLETVVALEAKSFNVVQISSEEFESAKKKVLKSLKISPVWASLQVTPQELDSSLRHKIQARKFIQFRAQSSGLPVTDSEAQRFYNENKAKYENVPFENSKEEIKSLLSKQQVDRRLKDWYDVLLSKYQVKNLIAEM